MTFFSILCALLIEQIRPLRSDNFLYNEIKALALKIKGWLNTGSASYGMYAWFLMMLILVVPTVVIYVVLLKMNFLFALLWNIIIVYITLGIRHSSHYFSAIQLALSNGDVATARTVLAEWSRRDTSEMEVVEISRVAVEKALISAHRHVFGVFFWFLMPLGPAGAVLYRMSDHLAHIWSADRENKEDTFGAFAARVFYWMDWIPVRLTAIAFAIVGNFEDAIYAWRNFASHWKSEAIGILLSAGGAAMGYRLGDPLKKAQAELEVEQAIVDTMEFDPDLEPGIEPNARALQSTVGLVWRALLLWMLLLLMLSIAVWLG